MSSISQNEFLKMKRAIIKSELNLNEGTIDLDFGCLYVGLTGDVEMDRKNLAEAYSNARRSFAAEELVKKQLEAAGITIE